MVVLAVLVRWGLISCNLQALVVYFFSAEV